MCGFANDLSFTPTGLRRPPRENCKHGHPWTSENIYVIPGSGSPVCRICKAIGTGRSARRKQAHDRRERQRDLERRQAAQDRHTRFVRVRFAERMA